MRKKLLIGAALFAVTFSLGFANTYARPIPIPDLYEPSTPAQSFSLDQTGKKYYSISGIPNLSGNQTAFGKLSLLSKVENKRSVLLYSSYWAPWQDDIYGTISKDTDCIYKFEKMIDLPVEVIDFVKLPTGYSNDYSFNEKYEYSFSVQKTVTNSYESLQSSSISSELGAGIAYDGMSVNGKVSSTYSVQSTYSNELSVRTYSGTTISYDTSYVERIENTFDTYCYVKRCIRRKFIAYIGYNYNHNYDYNSWGSGLFNRDQNYSYTYSNTTCTSSSIILVPYGDPYYELSYYLDDADGKYVYAGETNSSIIML